MSARVHRQGGFTLIEVMVVVAVVGILASIAIPNFLRQQVRARTSERPVVGRTIAKAVADHYVQNGSANLVGPWNPAGPPSVRKRQMVWNGGDDWQTLAQRLAIEGAVYYRYAFVATEAGVNSTLTVIAEGDVDGDGIPSTKVWIYTRAAEGYVLTAEIPPAGQEDLTTF